MVGSQSAIQIKTDAEMSANKTENIMATSTASDTESLPSICTEDLNTSDEETWLFASPRTNGNCKEWLRKDVDDPSLQRVRHTLVNKLDEIANTPRQTPINTPNDTPQSTPKHTPRETPDVSMCSSPNTSGLVTPDSPPYKGDLNCRTFVRPRRKKHSLVSAEEDCPDSSVQEKRLSGNYDSNRVANGRFESKLQHPDRNFSTVTNAIERMQIQHTSSGGSLAKSSGSLGSEDDDHLSSASDGSYCKISDVEDVNNLARLQEESLRMPDSNKASSRLRMSKLPAPRSSGRISAGHSQEDLLSRRVLSPQTSPYTSNSNLDSSNGSSNGLRYANQPRGDGYSSASSRGASPAKDLNTVPASRSRLQSPQVRGVVRGDRSKLPSLGGGIPRPSSSSSPAHRSQYQSGLKPPSRAPRVTPTPAVKAPVLKQPNDWREGCY